MLEDDKNFGTVLKSYLQIHDYEVDWVEDGTIAFESFRKKNYDICILDVMLPNVDGFTVAGKIREYDQYLPFIFLTAKTLKEDILRGFRLGADDYITKPFDSEVLLCKIHAILKRGETGIINRNNKLFKIGRYHFNYDIRTISYKSFKKKLTPKESELLKMLCLYENRTLPREKALIEIWGENNYFTTRSMDVFITKLRKYLKEDPAIEIMNVHSSGYRLVRHDQ